MGIVHTKTTSASDGSDTSIVRPSDWNADHTFTGQTNIGLTNKTVRVMEETSVMVKDSTSIHANDSDKGVLYKTDLTLTIPSVGVPYTIFTVIPSAIGGLWTLVQARGLITVKVFSDINYSARSFWFDINSGILSTGEFGKEYSYNSGATYFDVGIELVATASNFAVQLIEGVTAPNPCSVRIEAHAPIIYSTAGADLTWRFA